MNITQMELAFREEVVSLCELASPVVCQNRWSYFNLKNTNPEDFSERIISLSDKSFILAGIRFQGLDITKPFISVIGIFKEINEKLVNQIRDKLISDFSMFKPLSFHLTLPQGLPVPNLDYTIDRYTVMGKLKDVIELKLQNIPDKVELLPLNEMYFYDQYLVEYDLLYKKFPELKNEVCIEYLDSLNESADAGLLFEIQINGKRAGVIAGFVENYFGQKEICVLEELLFESYRGCGLAVYVQKEFAEKMSGRFEILWGQISQLNVPSLKTAIKNGRKITEVEYCFPIDE